MIQIQHLFKSFGKIEVLKNIDLELRKGECVALIGPNGCGKTTLMKNILGMVVPSKGSILFDGKEIKNQWIYRNQIGYMPQIGRYPENMTIGQVIHMMKDIRRLPEEELDLDLWHAFELSKILDKRMRTLSGGTRQKVSACLAFMFNAPVLILDEPTAGLDPLSTEILKQKILREKNANKLIIITSHILSDLDELVTEVVYMQDGQLMFHKNLDALKEETGTNRLDRAIAQIMSQANQKKKNLIEERI